MVGDSENEPGSGVCGELPDNEVVGLRAGDAGDNGGQIIGPSHT